MLSWIDHLVSWIVVICYFGNWGTISGFEIVVFYLVKLWAVLCYQYSFYAMHQMHRFYLCYGNGHLQTRNHNKVMTRNYNIKMHAEEMSENADVASFFLRALRDISWFNKMYIKTVRITTLVLHIWYSHLWIIFEISHATFNDASVV